MSIDETATLRVLKARTELITARAFYGVLVSCVEPVLSRKIPTMATNGKQHFFNPEFVSGLTQVELLGVQAHESEHDARHHGTRRNGRDPKEWNIACDYAINVDLLDEGFVLPKGALVDPKYRGMSAEDIYRSRELDAAKQKPQPPQDQDGEDEGDDGQQPDDANDEPSDDQAKNEGDKPDSDDGDDADEQGGQGEDDADEGTGGSASADDGDDADGDDADGEGAGSAQGEGDGQGTSSGDPGMCGEVLDSVGEDASVAELDNDWERVVRQAASIAKARGELPGHVSREIERSNNPPRDWRDELREFCEQGALRIETWNRPNRRFMGRGIVLPSTQKDGVSKAAFVIDTSGSMDTIALACVQNEAQAMLDDGIIDEAVIIYGDTQVTRVDTYSTGDEIEFDPRGGGGTDLKPLFQYVADEVQDATLMICFTDLMIGEPGPEPHCPVLFTVYGYPTLVAELIETAPWGARAIDVGVH